MRAVELAAIAANGMGFRFCEEGPAKKMHERATVDVGKTF